jgi:8-oxo-dGTP pyrophosphatase MutT (NUDIX family)
MNKPKEINVAEWQPMPTCYVLGFAFNNKGSQVLLMLKKRPDWQVDCYNGIGGRIEEGETPVAAMVREFEEEAGVKTTPDQWKEFAFSHGPEFKIHIFSLFSTKVFESSKTMTDEVLYRFPADILPATAIPNLHWLIPMARDINRNGYYEFKADLHYKVVHT